MKLLLEINDNKATFFMEVIKHFSFIKKATPISDVKATLMQDIKEAVDELNLVKSGELKARNAEEVIDEL